jgi:hypothetical protein
MDKYPVFKTVKSLGSRFPEVKPLANPQGANLSPQVGLVQFANDTHHRF